MLLKVPGEFLVDDECVLSNIRMNIVDKKFRLKAVLHSGDSEKALDIVANDIAFKFHGTSWTITLSGVDMTTRLGISLVFSHQIFKKENWLRGKLGDKAVDTGLSTKEDVKTLISNLI